MDTKDHIGVEVKRLDNEIHSRMAVYRVEKGQGELTMMQSWILGYLYEHPENEIFQRDIEVKFFVSVLANVQGTMFMKNLIDDYIVPLLESAKPDFGPLLLAIIKVGGFYAVGILSTFAYNRIMVYVTQGVLKNLRVELFTHMESLPVKYFDTHAHGDIMSVYTNDIDTLRQMISQSMPQLLSSVITIVSVMISMIILSVPLTLVTLVMIAVMLFTTQRLAGMSGKYFLAQQKDLGVVNGYVEEMMEGQKVVKVFCHEEESLEKFRELNENLYNSANNANPYGNMLGPVNAQLGNISYVVCAIVGGIFAIYQVARLTLGGLASFLTFNKSINMPINQVSQQLNSIVMALAGAERIFRLLDEQPELDEGYVTLVNAKKENGELAETDKRTGLWAWKHYHKADQTTTYTELKGDVVFNGVDFGYNDRKMVLHDVKLYAQPGQKIAFVGSTGAGKTTITNLINRFYDIQDGKIRYGKLDATEEEVMAAARLANADGFIRRLPEGYHTMLKNNGANLSQGQRQLLAIARAAVADPPVLILDEATSSIDTRTEKLVQDGMDKLMKGRTTFVIAHRLSTVRNSDCIMVLENGRIIERGTHDQLLQEKGKYYQLYTGNVVGLG